MIEGVAFASGGLRVELADVYRRVHAHGEHTVLLAEGVGSPFERIDPAITRALLDAAGDGVHTAPVRLLRARDAILARGGSADDGPEGWLLAASWLDGGSYIALASIGTARAWILDGDAVAAATRPHKLPFVAPGLSPFISTHGLGGTFKGLEAQGAERTPGTRLVIASSTVARVPEADLLALARSGPPRAAADAMLAAAIALTPDRWSVAAVFDAL